MQTYIQSVFLRWETVRFNTLNVENQLDFNNITLHKIYKEEKITYKRLINPSVLYKNFDNSYSKFVNDNSKVL